MGSVTTYPEKTGIPANSVEMLEKSNARLTLTGIATETAGNLATYVLPAGTMGPNDTLRIKSLWGRAAAGSANTQAIIRFGGATVTAGTVYLNNTMANTTLSAQHEVNIYANNSTSAQKAFPTTAEEEAHRESTTAIVTSAIDTTADVTIWFNAVASGAGDEQYLEAYEILLIRA